jgi:twitching motility protein PilT
VLRTTRSIRECIRDPNRAVEIRDHIEKGHSDMQMQTFDQHLLELYQANKIKLETARDAATNPRDFATKLALEGDSSYQQDDSGDPGGSDESRF